MKISFILYVFQFFIKNQHLTSHGIMYVFVDFLNFSNLTFHGIMYVFADFREKNFFTYFNLLQLLRFLPVSSIPVVCIINTCITYDLTRLRCMNHLSASCVDSHMSSVTYNITRLWVWHCLSATSLTVWVTCNRNTTCLMCQVYKTWTINTTSRSTAPYIRNSKVCCCCT